MLGRDNIHIHISGISRQEVVCGVGGGERVDLWHEQISIKMLNGKVSYIQMSVTGPNPAMVK